MILLLPRQKHLPSSGLWEAPWGGHDQYPGGLSENVLPLVSHVSLGEHHLLTKLLLQA